MALRPRRNPGPSWLSVEPGSRPKNTGSAAEVMPQAPGPAQPGRRVRVRDPVEWSNRPAVWPSPRRQFRAPLQSYADALPGEGVP